jgi:HrpA-like RNA helicase
VASEQRVSAAARGGPQLVFKHDADLPISARREAIMEALLRSQVLIVAGDTGSGKSTQLPQYCLELGRGIDALIAHTQPRRLAARALAARIAEEVGQPVGRSVGFRVRFADQVSDVTRLTLMTDGLLLAELASDPLLRRYDTVIVDEAHERTLNVDLLMGVLKRLLPRRPDLKVIVTSATLDVERISRFFDDAPIITVSGRNHPIEVRSRQAFEKTVDQGRARLHPCLEEIAAGALSWFTEARVVRRALDDPRTALLADAVDESNEHLRGLFRAGTLESLSTDWLRQLPRYLKAEERRWQRNRARGGESPHIARQLREWSARYQNLAREVSAEMRWIPELDDLQNWIEEYRVSLYAQELKTLGPISAAVWKRAPLRSTRGLHVEADPLSER